MEKIQLNIKEVPRSEFNAFLGLLHREFEPSKVNPTDDGHFIVYYYNEGKARFNVCYDMRAECVTATAEEAVLEKIKALLYRARSMQDSRPVERTASTPETTAVVKQPTRDSRAVAQKKASPEKREKIKKDPAPKTEKPAKANKRKKPGIETKTDAAASAYKDGYSLNKYDQTRLEQGVETLKQHAAVASVASDESQAGTAQHFIKYLIAGKDGSKATVQYAYNRRVVQIQGKPSELTDVVQNILSGKATETEIVKARIDYNKTRAEKKEGKTDTGPSVSAIKKILTKSMPHGVLYLSKQSQTYLYYALIDLNSNLSNYGGILATAYQGLENLIANLQQAQGIKVKMIGQAFDKPDGKYILKAAYRKRIKSVVYNEVMSALYTEYFEKRHFYTHSDNYSDVPRVLGDQTAAKAELARLVEVIEYNCTKLSEIGFLIHDAVIAEI